MRKIGITAVLLAAALLLLPLAGCGEKQIDTDAMTVETKPVYNPRELVSDLLGLLEEDPVIGEEEEEILSKLDVSDPQAAVKWRELAGDFEQLNTEEELSYGCAPDGLPEDDTLCFVVLGYQLNPDGSMNDELVGRLETALACAEQYPNALIAVTGGGTAASNDDATEADCMAQWLEDNGIPAERILIENSSLTTGQNAVYTAKLLREQYQEVESLVIVTSDYHVRCGWMTFETELVLAGDRPRVIAGVACETGRGESDLRYQTMWMEDVWSMQ